MKAELFPDTEANADGFNHALLNATMQTVRVALQDDVLNVYRVMRMMPRTICMMPIRCCSRSQGNPPPHVGRLEASVAVVELLSTCAADQTSGGSGRHGRG